MQRSISHQKPLVPFLYVVVFIFYSSLSTIYLFLPPLFAVLFVLYSKALKQEDFLFVMIISFCLVIYEANKGFLLFSSIIYFSLAYKFIMPKIMQNFSCKSCIKISYVVVAYLGYYIFLATLAKIFMQPLPDIDYYIIYYIVIEFFLVSIL